jgi:hypothetical protein
VPKGVVERCVNATAVKEAVGAAIAVEEFSDDLAGVVDAVGMGVYAQVIVESGVDAAAVEEAVGAVAAVVTADDLPVVVDAKGIGALGS